MHVLSLEQLLPGCETEGGEFGGIELFFAAILFFSHNSKFRLLIPLPRPQDQGEAFCKI